MAAGVAGRKLQRAQASLNSEIEQTLRWQAIEGIEGLCESLADRRPPRLIVEALQTESQLPICPVGAVCAPGTAREMLYRRMPAMRSRA